MFKKILIANRGEIAVRIIRSCREMGIKTVSVYSSADAEALHTNLAHEAYCIGPAEIEKSYLNIDAILCAALNCGADAIHPGYGFLADSPELSKRCKELGIKYIGASPEIIEASLNREATAAILKDTRIPTRLSRLNPAQKQIDVQLVRDFTGRCVIVGDRDSSTCHDKYRLIGEAPAYGITEKIRKKLHKAAVAAAEVFGFEGVGSAVFLVDSAERYCFNRFIPRLQVGYSVTEMQSRIDLIHWQIRLAAGDIINFGESTICRFGHSIGCRIFAIHPDSLIPSTGKLGLLHVPGGLYVQFHTDMYQGCSIPTEYQPLLGKLVVYSRTREHAIRKIRSALKELVTDGVYNNSEIYFDMFGSEEFTSGEYDIGFYDKHMLKKTQKN